MSRAAAPPSTLASAFGRHHARGPSDTQPRMAAWGERAVERLGALGLEVHSCTADDERVVFVPDGRLALELKVKSHVEVALELPPRDVPALRARLADAERALELTTVIEALPEQFEMGGTEEGPRVPASGASADELRELLDELEREHQGFWLGWRVQRSVAVQHAALLDGLLEDAIVALGGLLALVAWTPASAAESRGAQRPRRDRSRHDEDRKTNGTKRRARMRSRDHRERPGESPGTELRRSSSDREHEAETEPESPSEGDASSPRLQRPPILRGPARPGLLRRPMAGVDPRAPVDKGVRVRVLEGPFSGKVGVVQELDGKGGARVMLGLLAVRLAVKDVVACAEGRVRPLLSSSHRKPLPVRS
ncbi:MAG TPA: hypothetical protein VGL81_06640 [Polyangiaceae bacterium]